MAVLDEIENRNLLRQSAAVGNYLRDELKLLKMDNPVMGDVRGCGLFTGIDWVTKDNQPDQEGAVAVTNQLKEKGFLLSNAGALKNVLKVRPPLVFEKEHADRFLDAFKAVIKYG